MENQWPGKRRRKEAIKLGSTEEEDRISQLPGPILDHILSFLPQNDAVRTCTLSKSWRHLGPTGPKIEFDESSFQGRQAKFRSVVDKTLKRYEDQNRPILEFVLGISQITRPSVALLKKWIPKVVSKKGILSFNLRALYFSLPALVFQSEFLEELFLDGCKLDQIKNNNVKLQVLKRLSLHSVDIEDETFEKIMLSCPLIQHVVLDSCRGLSTIKLNGARNLKHFYSNNHSSSIEINDDVPSLETIRINGAKTTRFPHQFFFPRLKSLRLFCVHLPTDLLNNLSSDNCPCLEELELFNCSGCAEFKLSNRSIKRLIIDNPHHPITAAIDAANMIYFDYRSSFLPTISFSTTSTECKSLIMVWCPLMAEYLSTWSLKLHEFLKALSQTQIKLHISKFRVTNQDRTYEDDGGSCEPVVVEHFHLEDYYSYPSLRVVLSCLFRVFRPRYIGLSGSLKVNVCELAKCTWNTLVKKKKGEANFWQQDLEESSIQILEENAKEWRPGQVCEFSNVGRIRFMLKWRE